MSDETHAALQDALAAHIAAQAEAVASGQDPALVDRSAVELAAQAHLDDVDPGYAARHETVSEPDRRIVVPDLQAELLAAEEALRADPGDAKLRQKVAALAERVASAARARRVLEGRPITTTIGG